MQKGQGLLKAREVLLQGERSGSTGRNAQRDHYFVNPAHQIQIKRVIFTIKAAPAANQEIICATTTVSMTT
ncbi:hypothetical protein MTO96_052316 [Rhipicephalus appendiculatus]